MLPARRTDSAGLAIPTFDIVPSEVEGCSAEPLQSSTLLGVRGARGPRRVTCLCESTPDSILMPHAELAITGGHSMIRTWYRVDMLE